MAPAAMGRLVLVYGTVRVSRLPQQVTDKGETAQREESIGKATVYEVHGPDGVQLTIHDTRWLNGNRDVRVAKRNNSPERFDVLVGRLRLGVKPAGEMKCQVMLRVADPTELRPTRKQVSLTALHHMSGVDPRKHLLGLGATAVGTASELGLSKNGKQMNQLMVMFPTRAELVPLASFMLTTILPRVG